MNAEKLVAKIVGRRGGMSARIAKAQGREVARHEQRMSAIEATEMRKQGEWEAAQLQALADDDEAEADRASRMLGALATADS